MSAVDAIARRGRGLSIRLRLTLLYTTILGLTLLSFGSLLYYAQTQTVYDEIRSNLVRQAQGYVRTQAFPTSREPVQGGAPRAPLDASQSSGGLPGRWMQTRTLTGVVVARTPDLSTDALPISNHGLQAVQSGSGWFETGSAEDQPVMVYSMPFLARNGDPQIIQVAFPIAQPVQSLSTLRFQLISGSAIAILAAFLIGWILAGTALNPIDRITHTARAIGMEHDFSRRVAYDGPADEVGQLAVTFNGMLTELESAFRQLEGSLESQRRFVADASHELRTPLTTVRGNIDLLQRERVIEPEVRAEILSDTTEEVERLIRLVNQLLALARADAGMKLHPEPVPVAPLIEDVSRMARSLAPDSTIACPDGSQGAVMADRDALKQVLLILLDNAQRHTTPGTNVEITTERSDGQTGISVADDGPGIAPEALPHIFERFYRGEVSRSGPGAGLGLAIAKELVEAQGGHLAVSSQLGVGTTFTISLPTAPQMS